MVEALSGGDFFGWTKHNYVESIIVEMMSHLFGIGGTRGLEGAVLPQAQ